MCSTPIGDTGNRDNLWEYVRIARPDHWFKNVFMLLGVLLAVFYEPSLIAWQSLPSLGLAVIATCLVASSNYVINELLDGPTDRLHPQKRHRPVPSGRIRPAIAYTEWLLLGAAGIGIAAIVNPWLAAAAALLWVMGIVYNVRPLRTKEWPYVDVLTESVNNPIRLFLGWFALIPDRVPPLSLTLSYWMAGAFLMATKRFAELRSIGDRDIAAAYRRSFRHYSEDRLLVSMFFYATSCSLFAGVFIVRYHLELILFVPFAAGFFAYYLKLGLQRDSAVQNPERLYREWGFFIYAVLCVILFVVLMFASMPFLYDWFHVDESRIHTLWTIEGDG